MPGTQQELDRQNADFWDELCGSNLAGVLGITEPTPENLERFDTAYMEMYPYLDRYLPEPAKGDESLLEIGLGYGTVAQRLVERGFRYTGADISPGPVGMANYRIANVRAADQAGAQVASALELPFEDDSFDHVVSIGCLHSTGDLPRAVSEAHRVLAPGGSAWVMVYYSYSFRLMLRLRPMEALRRLRGRSDPARIRAEYDANTSGDAAPAIEFVSRREAKRLFGSFAEVRLTTENINSLTFRDRMLVRREQMLALGRLAGLDLYIVARK